MIVNVLVVVIKMAADSSGVSDWFVSEQVSGNLYWIREQYVCENQCNIWLIKGPTKDVVIDCGFGVCNLRLFLVQRGLIDRRGGERECVVVLTHVHFDHSGGAAHFDDVYIHSADAEALRSGSQVHTLNYVKPSHFTRRPPAEFSRCGYRVRPTRCTALCDGERIELGEGDYLEVLHVPGHTPGSILLHYPRHRYLFSGDFVYECGSGSGSALFDWLPTSSTTQYVASVRRVEAWCGRSDLVAGVYPGHMPPISRARMLQLIREYRLSRTGLGCRATVRCMNVATYCFFLLGCFRCCPC